MAVFGSVGFLPNRRLILIREKIPRPETELRLAKLGIGTFALQKTFAIFPPHPPDVSTRLEKMLER